MAQGSGLQISFEFFPPKTIEGMKNLDHIARELAEFAPDFFSVTFGAGGSTREGTLETVKMLQQNTPITIAPHLSCIGYSRADIIDLLSIYKMHGFKRLVALRGDLPSGMGGNCELQFASELISLIRETTGDYFHIDVAAYPECHPQAKNLLDDILNLKDKAAAGANSAITQYFFNADAYFYFRDQCVKQGITIPIIPGIMPIVHFAKLQQFSLRCGADIPRWLSKHLETYQNDPESLQAFATECIVNLCQHLLTGGAPGLHFYTLNHSTSAIKLLTILDVMPQKTVLKIL